MFLGINNVFGPTQTHKMSSEKGQKHIYAQEHQMYYYYNDFKGQLLYKKWKTIMQRYTL